MVSVIFMSVCCWKRSTIMMLLRAKRQLCILVSHLNKDCRVTGRNSRKNQMMLIQEGSGEVVDWPNRTQSHGVVLSPQQVGTKHHSQVAVGHFVDFTVGRYLKTQTYRLPQVTHAQ